MSAFFSPPTFIVSLLAAAALGTACGDSTPPTAPSTDPLTATEVYVGTMAPGGSGFFAFRVVNPGVVNITLASLTVSATGAPLALPMVVGLGVPNGEGCEVTTSVTTTPGLRAQLTSQAPANTYCVRLADAGRLTAPAAFGVRIVHP